MEFLTLSLVVTLEELQDCVVWWHVSPPVGLLLVHPSTFFHVQSIIRAVSGCLCVSPSSPTPYLLCLFVLQLHRWFQLFPPTLLTVVACTPHLTLSHYLQNTHTHTHTFSILTCVLFWIFFWPKSAPPFSPLFSYVSSPTCLVYIYKEKKIHYPRHNQLFSTTHDPSLSYDLILLVLMGCPLGKRPFLNFLSLPHSHKHTYTLSTFNTDTCAIYNFLALKTPFWTGSCSFPTPEGGFLPDHQQPPCCDLLPLELAKQELQGGEKRLCAHACVCGVYICVCACVPCWPNVLVATTAYSTAAICSETPSLHISRH